VNEALREHVTSAAFVLSLGKTHVAELVRIDLELAAEVRLNYTEIGKLHRCDMQARKGLEVRGLIIHTWEQNKRKYGKPSTNAFAQPGDRTYDYDVIPPSAMWNITRAGLLVCDLLKEAGLYQEYAGSLLPLIEAKRERKRAS
jgi:hypothetical protein